MTQHHILISIGSNIEREKHIRASRTALEENFENVSFSSVYESEAVGFDGSPFYNLVASATTRDNIASVCKTLKAIEHDNGRRRQAKKFSSRTLDLDLLTFDDETCEKPVVLPREEILFNAFVLLPLAELVPEQVHPGAGKTYSALWQAFDKQRQKLWPVNFTWSSCNL